MQWIELTINTTSDGIELLEAELTLNGYDSFIIDDEQQFQTFLETNRDYWDIVDESLAQSMTGVSRIRPYLQDRPDAREEILRLRQFLQSLRDAYPAAALGDLTLQLANVRDEDWENTWKQYYQPIPIGKRLLVVPKWLNPENPEARIAVRLDPGMIFGTGAHASTQMCMLRLEQLVRGGESVLDLGSGSGILSITALNLGAASSVGVDVDPKAEDIARENAAYNGIGADRFTAITGNVLTQREALCAQLADSYDIICLNIFADVIIPMASALPQFMHASSVVIFSGVLESRYDEVCAAIEAVGLTVSDKTVQDDWCCMTARKKH